MLRGLFGHISAAESAVLGFRAAWALVMRRQTGSAPVRLDYFSQANMNLKRGLTVWDSMSIWLRVASPEMISWAWEILSSGLL